MDDRALSTLVVVLGSGLVGGVLVSGIVIATMHFLVWRHDNQASTTTALIIGTVSSVIGTLVGLMTGLALFQP